MSNRIIHIIGALLIFAAGLIVQKDSAEAKDPGLPQRKDSVAVKTLAPEPAAEINSNDDYSFLELYYYGPDIDGYYDIYDPWDIYSDREGDSRERDNDDRDSQERDTMEE